jgi:hypothetical protein
MTMVQLPDPFEMNDDVNSQDYDNHSDNESSDDDDTERINIVDGLSSEALLALMEFQFGSTTSDDNNDERNEVEQGHNETIEKFGKDTLCATYRPEDASRIAETLRRLHDLDSNNCSRGKDNSLEIEKLIITPMIETIPHTTSNNNDDNNHIEQLVNALEKNGVIRINHVLSKELCQTCLQYINEMLDNDDTLQQQQSHTTTMNTVAHNEQQQYKVGKQTDTVDVNIKTPSVSSPTSSIMFGNVFSREHRFDMYLHPTGIMDTILQSLLNSQSILGQLFTQLLLQLRNDNNDNNNITAYTDAEFHELSCLISDPGSMAQPIHPDSPYYPFFAPLWTVFIALQDITSDMGGTVVVPGTHTEEFHNQLTGNSSNHGNSASDQQQHIRTKLKECQYERADLSIGDCIVMDARTFHYGDSNTSNQRRTLLYFTIRNPFHKDHGYPNCGSLYPELDGKLKLSQFNSNCKS